MSKKHLVIHLTESTGSPLSADEDRRMLDAWEQEGGDNLGPGSMVGGPEQSMSVMVRDGKAIFTDGPFPEFKEWFAGFDLVDGESVKEVAAYMAKHPSAPQGRILVLPLVEHMWNDATP